MLLARPVLCLRPLALRSKRAGILVTRVNSAASMTTATVPTVAEDYTRLCDLLREISALEGVSGLLGWVSDFAQSFVLSVLPISSCY